HQTTNSPPINRHGSARQVAHARPENDQSARSACAADEHALAVNSLVVVQFRLVLRGVAAQKSATNQHAADYVAALSPNNYCVGDQTEVRCNDAMQQG